MAKPSRIDTGKKISLAPVTILKPRDGETETMPAPAAKPAADSKPEQATEPEKVAAAKAPAPMKPAPAAVAAAPAGKVVEAAGSEAAKPKVPQPTAPAPAPVVTQAAMKTVVKADMKAETPTKQPASAARSGAAEAAAPKTTKPAPKKPVLVEKKSPAPAPYVAAQAHSLSFPLYPGLTEKTSEAWLAPAREGMRVAMAIQTRMLDHACSELKAGIADLNATIGAGSPSDAMVCQGKSLTRLMESNAAYFADLAITMFTAARPAR